MCHQNHTKLKSACDFLLVFVDFITDLNEMI